MSDDDEVTVLICAPTEWGARKAMIPGTVESLCHDCSQPVWLSPSGLKIQAEQGAILVCTPCGEKSVLANPDTVIGDLTDEQKRELEEAFENKAEQN